MSKINDAMYELHHLERLSMRDKWVNRMHPSLKIIMVVLYIIVLMSINKYNLAGTAFMAVFLFVGYLLADLSVLKAIKRVRLMLPLVLFVGIFNPLLDRNAVIIAGHIISAGWISLITLLMKGIFALLAGYFLVATTSIEKICYGLRKLHMPKILVTEVMLIYRYLTVLLKEVNTIMWAYSLRAPGENGVSFRAWGSLAGQLMLRSMDRANRVYESMKLRGYNGDFNYFEEDRKK